MSIPKPPFASGCLTFLNPLRFLLAAEPQALTAVLAVARHATTLMIRQSGLRVLEQGKVLRT
jgi:hypothetical protein